MHLSKADTRAKLIDEAVCQEAGYEAIDEKEVKDFLENRAVKLKVDIPKLPANDFLVKTLKVVKQ